MCVDQPNPAEWGSEFLTSGTKHRVIAVDGDAGLMKVDTPDPVQRWWSVRRFQFISRPPCGGKSGEPPKSIPETLDPILQPHHYSRFVIEPITFTLANKLPFNIGNVVKYACRYDAKNGIEDLEKAKRYLDIHIEMLKREERIKNGEDAREVWKVMI